MTNLIPIKCNNCPKTLMFVKGIKEGLISKDCPRCGHRNIIKIEESRIVREKTKELG